MASDKEYLDYVIEQFGGFSGITYRKMMGEYILYFNGKIFGGIYDNRFMLKPYDCFINKIKNPVYELPYQGAKPMILVDDVDNRDFFDDLCNILVNIFRG